MRRTSLIWYISCKMICKQKHSYIHIQNAFGHQFKLGSPLPICNGWLVISHPCILYKNIFVCISPLIFHTLFFSFSFNFIIHHSKLFYLQLHMYEILFWFLVVACRTKVKEGEKWANDRTNYWQFWCPFIGSTKETNYAKKAESKLSF